MSGRHGADRLRAKCESDPDAEPTRANTVFSGGWHGRNRQSIFVPGPHLSGTCGRQHHL